MKIGIKMPYSQLSTLSSLKSSFDLNIKEKKLFENIEPISESEYLKEALKRAKHSILFSEKAKSEAIIMPILLEVQELNLDRVKVFSGVRLDVDESRNLNGECDFILARGGVVDVIEKPIISIVEAKRGDIDLGLGQCSAQMIGASEYNKKEGIDLPVYGAVTNSNEWKFLKLKDRDLTLDSDRYYLNDLRELLGVFQTIIDKELM